VLEGNLNVWVLEPEEEKESKAIPVTGLGGP
jgi:hypothetical protein